MIAWFGALDLTQKIFAAVAIPATVILIIQSILLFFGFDGHGSDGHDVPGDLHGEGFGDGHGDVQTDASGDGHVDGHGNAHGDGVALFSVRGIVAFFTVGGWLGVVLIGSGVNLVLSVILSFIAGSLSLYGIAMIMKAALKLQSSGNLDLRNAVGLTGRVYIKIPASGKGVGKVNVMIQERYTELEAITLVNRDLKADEMVTVTGVQNQGVLVVQPYKEDEAPQRKAPKK